MRLIPPTIAESTQSGGERAVFDALAATSADRAAGAGDAAATADTASWTVLHSFDIADHRRQLAGEIDFLCIVPGKGVLVVEGKGCHELRRHGGDWYYGRSSWQPLTSTTRTPLPGTMQRKSISPASCRRWSAMSKEWRMVQEAVSGVATAPPARAGRSADVAARASNTARSPPLCVLSAMVGGIKRIRMGVRRRRRDILLHHTTPYRSASSSGCVSDNQPSTCCRKLAVSSTGR